MGLGQVRAYVGGMAGGLSGFPADPGVICLTLL